MWVNGWFPLHDAFLEDADVADSVEVVGFEVEGGALQGYLVDKKTGGRVRLDELGRVSSS